MSQVFAETLRNLRMGKGLSQQQLAEKVFVNRSTIAKWEAGSRLPDMDMIHRLAKAFDMDVNFMLNAAWESEESPNIILVDDERVILSTSRTSHSPTYANGWRSCAAARW